MSEPTDEKAAVPLVTFQAPSGRLYKHQEDWEGDLLVPVDGMGYDGRLAVYESIPFTDLDALMMAGVRQQLITMIKEMDDDDIYRVLGVMALLDVN